MTETNGAHVKVTANVTYSNVSCTVEHGGAPCPDPLYVPAIEPCHTTGRVFAKPIVRELLRSFGVLTCPDCHRFTGMAPRVERNLVRKGSGWRERP